MSKRYIDMTEAERLAAANDLLETDVILSQPVGTRQPSRRAVEANMRELEFLLRIARSRGDAWPKTHGFAK